jgi:hypothetical protein
VAHHQATISAAAGQTRPGRGAGKRTGAPRARGSEIVGASPALVTRGFDASPRLVDARVGSSTGTGAAVGMGKGSVRVREEKIWSCTIVIVIRVKPESNLNTQVLLPSLTKKK